jgi:predicted ester cyclase
MTAADLKALIAPFQAAMVTAEEGPVRRALGMIADDATLHLCHPFGDVTGPDGFWTAALGPLLAAMPDLERREMIVLAGTTPEGQDWIGTCGNYMGTFLHPFLGIPPTGHLAHMRYHEFFRVENGKITEMQAIWDIPELMMQANAWPLAPQLGAFLATPGPATQDGLTASGDGSATMHHVLDMLAAIVRHPSQGGPEVMELDRYWHPRFNWYGPAGIGTARGVSGFRNWHQIPFLAAMPDRALDPSGLMSHWVAEGNYVCETGWPNMRQTLSHGGWLGLPATGKPMILRSLDFWRVADVRIRENWVLVDLLDAMMQQGLDALGRMRAIGRARPTGAAPIARDDAP